MRALVVGASGQVGGALRDVLARRGHVVLGTHTRVPAPATVALDLTDRAAVGRLFDEFRADWIFCTGALTQVDYCEDHPEETARVNRDAPCAAAALAGRLGAGFLFFSSEYVFAGAAGPYAEDDPARPLSVYGRTKWEAEQGVRRALARSLVVRTAVVYGPERQEKNFVYQVIRRLRSGEPVRVPSDQVSSPTFNADLAAASVELAERDLAGVYHVAGASVLDRHAFALLIARTFGLDPRPITPVPTAGLGQRAPRPLRGGLRLERAQAVLTTRLRSAADGLEAMRGSVSV